jgi:hypothetical protein
VNSVQTQLAEAHKARLSRFGVSAVPRVPVVDRPPQRAICRLPPVIAKAAPKNRAKRIPERPVPVDADLWIYHGLAGPPTRETVTQILNRTAQDYGLDVDEILSDRRKVVMVFARMVAIHRIARAYPGWSYPRIGKAINRDHTTIMYALGLLERKPSFLAEVIAAA